jgi:diketogulonate reductase-like aldo/keto reductase
MDLPLVGLGTWTLRGDKCAQIVRLALEIGYRHIDTAHIYENHQAIRQALQGFAREQVFMTSKMALEEQVDPKKIEKSVRHACDQTLQELGTDYLDLYLIHAPNRSFPLNAVYEAMQQLIDLKKVRQLGVSNYTIHHLEDLRKAGFIPFANQVEFHPYLNQKELLAYCRMHGIRLISFRSFGKGTLLSEEPLFDQIGSKYGKTGAQVILHWLIQQDIPVIPKASSEKHLRENLEIFDFSLSDTEMSQLDQLHRNKRYCRPDNPEYTY